MALSSSRGFGAVVAWVLSAAAVAGGCGGSDFSGSPSDAGAANGAGRSSTSSSMAGAAATDGGASESGAGEGGAGTSESGAAGELVGEAGHDGAHGGVGGVQGGSGGGHVGAGGASGGMSGALSGGTTGNGGAVSTAGGAGKGGTSGSSNGGTSGSSNGGTSGSSNGGTSGSSNGGSAGACTPVSWFPDSDGDGFGRTSGEVSGCEAPTSGTWVSKGGDCNDDNDTVFPESKTSSDEGYVLSGGGTSFDYDCSGVEELDAGQLGAAPTFCSILSCNDSGFRSTGRTGQGVNALCGSKSLVTCTSGTLTCTAVVSEVTDGIRCH